MLPPNLVVAGETGFGGEGTCDFYYSGRYDKNGLKVYYLKEEKLKEVNIDCWEILKKPVFQGKMSFDECINLKESLNYLCQFKVIEPITEDILVLDFIRAKASYVYETDRKTVVDIFKTPLS